jgi:hypothetical protein
MEAEVVVVTSCCKLPAGKGKFCECERAASRSCLTLQPHIFETSAAPEFIEMGEESKGWAVHGVPEKDRGSTIKILFA